MFKGKIIAIGAPACRLITIKQILNKLPENFPAAILIILQLQPNCIDLFGEILQKDCKLIVRYPQQNEIIRKSYVYLSPQNRNMTIGSKGQLQLSYKANINKFRPIIDPLFLSLAQIYQHQVIGTVLADVLNDGTVGLSMVKNMGGVTITQNPNEAEFPIMPFNTFKNVNSDFCLSANEISQSFIKLVEKIEYEGFFKS